MEPENKISEFILQSCLCIKCEECLFGWLSADNVALDRILYRLFRLFLKYSQLNLKSNRHWFARYNSSQFLNVYDLLFSPRIGFLPRQFVEMHYVLIPKYGCLELRGPSLTVPKSDAILELRGHCVIWYSLWSYQLIECRVGLIRLMILTF